MTFTVGGDVVAATRPNASSDAAWRTALLLGAITAAGGGLRFYGLAWGAPYFHFHQDEHFVFSSAALLRIDPHAAAMSPKFFMYGPLLPYLIDITRSLYEVGGHRLNLAVPHDELVYMLIGRAIVAAIGTATIPLVYAIAARLAGRLAGLLAALFLACSVLHIQSSHFATTDIPMTFFCVLTLWCALRVTERPARRWLVAAGLAFGAATVTKYAGAFVLGVVGCAYLLSPSKPSTWRPVSVWGWWVGRGIVPIVAGIVLFLALDPLAWRYFTKFTADIKEWVTDPLTGATTPIWAAQFADIRHPVWYWFTNLLAWAAGPPLEIFGLIGTAWLFVRGQRESVVAGVFTVAYFVATGGVSTPFVRYAVPLMPVLAIAAAVLGADLIALRLTRRVAQFVVVGVALSTVLYAVAYMNVYRQPDSRLQASEWLLKNVPPDSQVLVEPSQNTPPTGGYLANVNFSRDYVLWGPPRTPPQRHDYFQLHTLDAYRTLYERGPSDDDRRRHIARALAAVDWIVIDDSYVQWYRHLARGDHGVMKQYYEDIFAGRLGFSLVETFKTYPAIAGVTVNDDAAEMTFRHFDHPRVFIFRRGARSAADVQ